MIRDAKWEEDVLAYDPFGGDEAESTVIEDRIVKCRKTYECHDCAETIRPGDRARAIRSRNDEPATGDRVFATFRFCLACCDAAAASWEDDGKALEERYRIGEARRSPSRSGGTT